ncbi:hypothetical protein [Arthrobacter sp. 24S4-2]|uniref:hypothetical protein n=1 Tax=Arthrobacter sp. 24S4-2 TaxID=2575374 RepID=UPI0020C7E747|nr:hypothetical protein [Arthrobacter sp. 24S4-2]
MALSKPFPDKPAAVAGIAAVREYAGMGFVTEIPAPEVERTAGAFAVLSTPLADVAGDVPSEAGEKRKVLPAGSVSPSRQPKTRITSAARALGGRAASRKQQILVRWRQSLRPEAAVAGFRPC